MAPGSTMLTGMPHGASSTRSASDSDSSAALLAAMGPIMGTATRAVAALMFTTRPRPARSSGRNAPSTVAGPMTLTSNWSRRSAGARSSMGPCTIRPALLITACRPRPSWAPATSAAARATLSVSVTSRETGRTREPST